MENKYILQVKDLKKYYPAKNNRSGLNGSETIRAVDNLSFNIEKGTALGLVGESGCGKTTLGRCILRLVDITSGSIIFDGKDITKIKNKNLRNLRPKMQIVFQDPYSSLNPRLPVGEIIGEAVRTHRIVSKSKYKDYILEIMNSCGLYPEFFSRYPHEFSAGQRQRVCIARAIALKPEFLVCDEPVSALDVSIQAQIINLLSDLREKYCLSYLFISHDLSVVKHISNNIAVMYMGKIVEFGPKNSIFDNPMHPYTQALLDAAAFTEKNELAQTDDGCKFRNRCRFASEICKNIVPPLKEQGAGHSVACHLYR